MMDSGMIDPSILTFKLEVGSITDNVHTHTDWPRTEWEQLVKLGEGAHGEVYLQRERTHGTLRAVKTMHKRQLRTRKMDVKRELVNMIAVREHADLFVKFHHWYEDGTYIYLAMEYISGGNLAQRIRSRGTQGLGNIEATSITIQLLKGLFVLHQKGICHRDLKPENILVASSEPLLVKLADFGISKSTVGTNARTTVGTMGFIAPEIQGFRPSGYLPHNEYTFAVDIWALGCLVHQMLTTELPFLETISESNTGDSIMSGVLGAQQGIDMKLFSQYCNGQVPLPIDRLRYLNPSAANLVEKLLAFHPDHRPTATDAMSHEWLRYTR